MIRIIASEKDIMTCRFQSWYPKFSKFTAKSKLIKVTEAFINYLNQDGIYDFSDDEEDDKGQESVDDEEELYLSPATADQQNFANELAATIHEVKCAIETLQAPIFCKFNWSAPIDAVWMNAGSTKCFSYNEIFLLLKSSDRVAFDVDHTFDLCPRAVTSSSSSSSSSLSSAVCDTISSINISTADNINKNSKGISDNITVTNTTSTTTSTDRLPPSSYIILRKWVSINPALEFRLFIINDRIVKVCQRDCTTFYPFLISEKSKWLHLISSFYEMNIAGNFELSNYTMDVYITSKEVVKLVDFNPFGEPTSALMFEWIDFLPYIDTSTVANALNPHTSIEVEIEPVELRLVESERDALPSTKGIARAPIDVTQAPEFFRFMQVCKEQAQNVVEE